MSSIATPGSLLLDSNVIVWLDQNSKRLSAALMYRLQTSPQVYISSVTAWELSIKQSTGKLALVRQVSKFIRDENMIELPVTVEHGEAVRTLPMFHRDPFDRLLVAQAQIEGLTLVTSNRTLIRYGIPILLV